MNSGITITAPIDGQVLTQMVTIGQRVDVAMPLYRIAKLNTLWLEIYAPLANRLSMGRLKGKLEDAAFKFAYPKEYEEVKKLLLDKKDVSKYLKLGFFQVDYKNIPLKTNSYYIQAGIFGKADQIAYDFLGKSNLFKVISSDKNQGIVDIIYNWD